MSRGRLQQLAGAERDHAALGNDDVVEDADADQVADLDEPLGDGDVFLAGLGVARGMVVDAALRAIAGWNTSRGYVVVAVMWCSAAKSFWPLSPPSRDAT